VAPPIDPVRRLAGARQSPGRPHTKRFSRVQHASLGVSDDNALAESVIGLYKTEIIRREGPWRNLEAVELATLRRVDWLNNRRLLEPIGNILPVEYEQEHYRIHEAQAVVAGVNQRALRKTRGGSLPLRGRHRRIR